MKRLLLILVLLAGMAATTEASNLSKWLRGRNHRNHRNHRGHYRQRDYYRPYPMTRREIYMERRRYERRYYHYRAPFTFHSDF